MTGNAQFRKGATERLSAGDRSMAFFAPLRFTIGAGRRRDCSL